MRPTASHSGRNRDPIDEYDLGERFKRWAEETSAKALTYVLAHPKPIAYSSVAALVMGVTWWIVAHHRPAEPPPPSAWRIRQMTKSVEEADKRVRAENADRFGQDSAVRGVFETMRDVPVPLANRPGVE